MGLSSLPAPSEGVLCIVLVNTAWSISVFKSFIRTILWIIGFRIASSASSPPPPPSESTENRQYDSFDFIHLTPSETYIEQFRNRTPAVRFDAVCCGRKGGDRDCSVCLTQYEPESEINHLSCGHVFHKSCLEKWLDYWNITCPLCRTPVMQEEETSCVW